MRHDLLIACAGREGAGFFVRMSNRSPKDGRALDPGAQREAIEEALRKVSDPGSMLQLIIK